VANLAVNAGHQNVAMLGIGAARPKRLVSNDEVCEILDSTDEWIFERSGIRNRRWISGDESARSLAATAADRAIANSGVEKEKVGALILATGSWKTKIPHGGPIVAYDIGLNGIPAYDIAAGCGGFGYSLGTAADMVRAGTAEYVLVVGVETMSVVMDPTDRNTAFIFGDGAGAVVVGPSEENGISPTVWGSDGENADAISQNYDIPEFMDRAQEYQDKDPQTDPVGRMVVTMEGSRVFRWAAITLPKALQSTMELAGVDTSDIEVFIPHRWRTISRTPATRRPRPSPSPWRRCWPPARPRAARRRCFWGSVPG
jgi:beta-ketoacyl ACP synthase